MIPSNEVQLNVPELTFAKTAQLGRHESVNTRSEYFSPWVPRSIPIGGYFFAELFYSNTILEKLSE